MRTRDTRVSTVCPHSAAMVVIAACSVPAWLYKLEPSLGVLKEHDLHHKLSQHLPDRSVGAACCSLCLCCRHIGSNTDLLPLLQLPADDPRDASTPAAGPSSSSSTTLMTTLRRLDQQAKLYQ